MPTSTEDLPRLALRRLWTNDEGTGGVLITEDGVFCNTLELPWRDNRPQVSCIPCGEYRVSLVQSPKFGRCYSVEDVPNRSVIRIHSGNLAGDIHKGYHTHVQGCILLGRRFGRINGQCSISVSRPTIADFMRKMNGQDFILTIDFEETGPC